MTVIDFYLLSDTQTNSRWLATCYLVEQAYQAKKRIYVHTDQIGDAHRLNELLWTFRDDAFLPHALYNESQPAQAPILIGCTKNTDIHWDLLINLGKTVPDFYKNFPHIVEWVESEGNQRIDARERFRFYRSNNHTLSTRSYSIPTIAMTL